MLTEIRRGHIDIFTEHLREIVGVLKSTLPGDLVNGQIGVAELAHAAANTDLGQITDGGVAQYRFECLVDVKGDRLPAEAISASEISLA